MVTVRRYLIAVVIGSVLGSIPVTVILAHLPTVPVGHFSNSASGQSVILNATQWSEGSSLSNGTGGRSFTASDFVQDDTAERPIRLVFVGDIILDRNVARRMQESGDPMYSFRKLPEHWFDSFDYAVANLEGPVTNFRRPPEKTIDFLFTTSVIPILQASGIDAFSQANNHTLDQGSSGFRDSRSALSDAGFLVFGHQVNDDEIALATTTIKGVRFALLGFNTTDNPLDRTAAARVMRAAKANADHTIIFMHWGSEYHDRPDPATVEEAHWLMDQGADIVIGGHPHWVQGIESYHGKPIVYSLGNFIFDQDFSLETRQGLALGVTIRPDRISLEPLPIQIDKSQPRLVEGNERVHRLQSLAAISEESLRQGIETGALAFVLSSR